MTIIRRAFPGGPWDFETRISRLFNEAVPGMKPDFVQVSLTCPRLVPTPPEFALICLWIAQRRRLGLFVDVQPRCQVQPVLRRDPTGRPADIPDASQAVDLFRARSVARGETGVDHVALAESG